MSKAKEQNDKLPKGKGAGPTRSFDSSVTGPGSQIGPFRIEQELGRGGMGVVYLAHDTKLDRPVAIKSIPPELTDNPKARSRFSREARVLASLNHPHIATIYEEIEDDRGVGYLILEYVPGQTLAERIAKKPLKLEEVLSIALQIAEAVAAAHEHDVIHRDLKPGNIKITPEGKVKVLDFGLAKAVGGEALDQQSTVTEPGRVIGTPAYMSPEQARGKPTDKRSDIWSFGCVLYEMLTGKIPFKGETISDTLANILQTDPNWQALPQTTPMNIRSLLRHCLKKDPRRRLQHIGDAGIEIDETLSSLTIGVATVGEVRPVGPRKLLVWRTACLILILVVTSLLIWNLKRSGPPRQPTRRFIIDPETNLAREALWSHALAFSPDGKHLAYVEEGSDRRRRIYLRRLDEFKAKPLSGTEGAISPFFSPNGESIGYVDHHQRELKKISIKGGQPTALCDSGQFRGGSWGTDDTIIFARAGSGLWCISGEGLEQFTVPDANQNEIGHYWPQILPNGDAVLFTNVRPGGLQNQIEVYSLKTRERHVLFKDGTYARYVPTGHIVYGRNNTLYAVRFDLEQFKVIGSRVPLVPGVRCSPWNSGSTQFAISRDGSLAYIPFVTPSTELTPVRVDRQGLAQALPAATPRDYYNLRISPNGAWLAFTIIDGDNRDVWIYDLMRHTLNPLSSDGISDAPIWTPDSKEVVFRSYRAGKVQLHRQSVTGSGKPESFATFEGYRTWPSCCSPDGKELLLLTLAPGDSRLDNDIMVLKFEKQPEKPDLRPFIQRNNNQRSGGWHPGDRWIAYSSDETGRWEVYVEPYPGPGKKTIISTEGGYAPRWSRDGKELFYRGGRDNPKMMAVTYETEPEFRVIESKELFETINFRDYDVDPNGQFLMIREPRESTSIEINVVLNWFAELKRLVPTGKD